MKQMLKRCFSLGAISICWVVSCASPQSIPAPLATEKVAEEKPVATPDDAFFIKQIHARLMGDEDSEEAMDRSVTIKNRRTIPAGFVLESLSFGPAPCEEFQISTFAKDGTLIDFLPLVLGCDCPSECEGCYDWKTVHWTDDTHFAVKREATHITNTAEELAARGYENCDTEVIHTRIDYEVAADGRNKAGEEKTTPRPEKTDPAPDQSAP